MIDSKPAPYVLKLRQSKRKRPTTPVKKRNLKYKQAPKIEIDNCALCDFTFVSCSKVIHHMKTKHTDASHAVVDVATKMVVEDISVGGLSE